MYGIRSSIVHSGIDYISKEDLETLAHYVRVALLDSISINYKFNNEINRLQKRDMNNLNNSISINYT